MRIVVKVGTNVLTGDGDTIDRARARHLIEQIVRCIADGHQMIFVTSGAVAFGRQLLPTASIAQKKQVWAAVGQPALMELYKKDAADQGVVVGQCLLLRSDFTERERYDNFIRTIEGLLATGALPVINENDVVATADLTVGDNDLLAATIAVAVDADKLILLTNQKALYTANPDTDPSAELIGEVSDVAAALEKLCDTEISSWGRGGMMSKVRAAKHAVAAGIETYIADGRESDIIEQVITGKAVGTRFVVKSRKIMNAQKRWLMSSKGFGEVVVDSGAVRALKSNKSLLLPGILGVRGIFDAREVVEIVTKNGEAIGYGKTNYSSKDILKILGIRKMEKNGATLDREVIHRSYMVTL